MMIMSATLQSDSNHDHQINNHHGDITHREDHRNDDHAHHDDHPYLEELRRRVASNHDHGNHDMMMIITINHHQA